MKNAVKSNTINPLDYVMFGGIIGSFFCVGKVVEVTRGKKSATKCFTIDLKYEKINGEWIPSNVTQTFTTYERSRWAIKIVKHWKDEDDFIHDMFCELV